MRGPSCWQCPALPALQDSPLACIRLHCAWPMVSLAELPVASQLSRNLTGSAQRPRHSGGALPQKSEISYNNKSKEKLLQWSQGPCGGRLLRSQGPCPTGFIPKCQKTSRKRIASTSTYWTGPTMLHPFQPSTPQTPPSNETTERAPAYLIQGL